MAREHCQKPIQDSEGNLLPQSVVRLIDKDTGYSITTPIYMDDTSGATYENPWTSTDGMIDFYLDQPARLKIGVTPPGMIEFFFDNVDVGDAEIYKETLTFAVSGVQAVKSFGNRFYIEDTSLVLSVRASVGMAPLGADLVVDVKKNGTSIFASAASRPRVLAGEYVGFVEPTGIQIDAGDYLTIEVVQVGTTTAGSDLTVQVRVKRTP